MTRLSVFVSIELIDRSPWAELFPHDEEHIARLQADIEERGIQTPLHVFPKGDRFELLAGHDRLEAARRARLTEVPVAKRSTLGGEDARFEYFLKDNTLRKDVDKRMVAKAAWLRWPDSTIRQIAKRAGVGRGTAERARADLIEAGQLSHVGQLEGADGKARPRTYSAPEPDLEALPEPERPRAAALLGSPGVPPKHAARMAKNLSEMEEEERSEIYNLAESDDARDRSLAITRAAKMPPMPDPRSLWLIKEATSLEAGAGQFADEASVRREIEEMAERLRELEPQFREHRRTA